MNKYGKTIGDFLSICEKARQSSKYLSDDYLFDIKGMYEKPVPSHEAITDLGNEKRLTEKVKGTFIYVHQINQWFVWSGSKWKPDETGALNQIAKTVGTDIENEALAAFSYEITTTQKGNKGIAKQLGNWSRASKSRRKVEDMIVFSQTNDKLKIHSSDLNRNKNLLNFQNGTLDLKTMKFNKNDPVDLITKSVNCDYDQKAKAPRWDKFLHEIFAGDTDLINYVKQAVGYSLSGKVNREMFFFLFGTGKNGKSVFCNTLLSLMGDYSLKTNAETLMIADRHKSINNDVARLAGARMVIASEIGEGKKFNESLLKDLTGRDTITARYLHKEFFQFQPEFTLFIYGNHKPIISGSDVGITRRIKLVPFDVKIEKPDINLEEKLLDELPGIMNWALEGWAALPEDGEIDDPPSVKSATKDYLDEMDVIGNWMEECIDTNMITSAHGKDLYDNYRKWAIENGYYAMGKKTLNLKLEERGFSKARERDGTVFRGMRIK